MLWHIQILDLSGNVKQQIDFEGSEARAKQLASTTHLKYKKEHKETIDYGPDRPLRKYKRLPRWQHEWK